ncbi:MAG: ABC transporter ATP-binding protein [Candidatus Dojkabacteria bacterium]|jgi:ABC-type multidrug transport system fused ATPase/permease subunit|nr:ABC transporter ATP-binding protein [Candidatus Dojkabacteria bacterium]
MLKEIVKGLKYGLTSNKFLITSQWVLNAINQATPLLFSIIWAKLVDTAINGIQNNSLTFSLMIIPFILYGVIELVRSLTGKLDDALQTVIYDKLELKIHTDVIQKYSSLDIQSLEDPEVNRLFQVIRESYEWRIRHLIFTFGKAISAFAILGISSFILFRISPLVMFIIVVSSIPSVLGKIKFGSIDWGIWHADADKFRKFNLTKDFLLNKDNLLEANINNISPHLVGVIKEILSSYHQKRKPVIKKRFFLLILTDLIGIVGSIYSVYLLITLALTGTISIGSLILGSSIFLSFSSGLGTFLYEVTELYESGLFMRDFNSFMSLKPRMSKGSILLEKLDTPPTIEFKNVSFTYPNTDKVVLKDIDLLIKPGMKVALVGENGVGKTTLIKLLARFYMLDSGSIKINDQDLADIDTESWEQNLGLLTQHFNTYPAFSVEENIYFGNVLKVFDKKDIIIAAQKANVTGFVEKYKNKFKQILSIQFKDGIDPSWGQWQRLGIARTLYRDAPVVIFDEPTSSIDAQAEYEIFENINNSTKGKTVIYVSHRYSTVRNADLICVLKNGVIIESGNHRELMSINGEYAKNFKLQASGYSD